MYFYCARDASKSRRADPKEVLRAIVKQLSCHDFMKPVKEFVVREYQGEKKRDAEEDGSEPSKLSSKLSTKVILALTDQIPATLIIDGLDECQPSRRYELLNALDLIVEQSTSLIKILVSSRDDADHVSRLIDSSSNQTNASDNCDDIKRLIHHDLSQAIRDQRLLNGKASPEYARSPCQ